MKVSYSDVGEGGVAVNCEKTQFFLNTLYLHREDNGCRDESYCNGSGTSCPPSQLKPNKTVCNQEFVCFLGVSNIVKNIRVKKTNAADS